MGLEGHEGWKSAANIFHGFDCITVCTRLLVHFFFFFFLSQDCRENTAGPYCDICAAGYYGDPINGVPCRPCQCPTTERNHAVTCSVGASGQFSCQCQPGYTGPKCDRCDYGYYGDLNSRGSCVSCRCNPHGSLSDQCDERTGQCFCVDASVTGRDCSQCAARQILSSATRSCRNCDDGCVGELLDTVVDAKRYFDDADVSDIDPAPMLRLIDHQKRHKTATSRIVDTLKMENDLFNVESLNNQLKPQAELAVLEAKKYLKSARDADEDARQQFFGSRRTNDQVKVLQQDLKHMIDFLESYAISEESGINIKKALKEVGRILNHIKSAPDFGPIDIEARRELSHSRRVLTTIQDILYGEGDLERNREKLDEVERKINDLLQYINAAMETTRSGYFNNNQLNDTLEIAKRNCLEIHEAKTRSKNYFKHGKTLIEKSKLALSQARDYFKKLGGVFGMMEKHGEDLEKIEIGLSEIVEDYRQRYVIPCRDHALRLSQQLTEILNTLGNDLNAINRDERLRAAQVYIRIMESISEARKAAGDATRAATDAYRKIHPLSRADQPDESDERAKSVKIQAEMSRIRSQDLLQEAEGLHINTINMENQITDLKVKWNVYMMRLEEHKEDVMNMNIELDRFGRVGSMAASALDTSHQALTESEAIYERVLQTTTRITMELRRQVEELRSFAPDELGNIPRKCKFFLFKSLQAEELCTPHFGNVIDVELNSDFFPVTVKEARRMVQNAQKQATYLSHRDYDIGDIRNRLSRQISDVKEQIRKARQAASNVKISITNQRSERLEFSPQGCSRTFRGKLEPGMTTKISLIFGIDTSDRDGMLVYIPASGGANDFVAIDMVDRKIRFLWNNGANTQIITHNVTIESAMTPSNLLTDQHMWYKITAERIGNIGRLNVRKVRPIYDHPDYHKWVVDELPASAFSLDAKSYDDIYVGGGLVPDYLGKSVEFSTYRFNGVLFELSVNGKLIGLWNYVRSEGCRETHSGVTDDGEYQQSCFAFNGEGYATQRNIKNYDPRYLSVSMEVQTFDENALLLLAVNYDQSTYLSLTLQEGLVHLVIKYKGNHYIQFTSDRKYNRGEWFKIEAARAVRSGTETGVLRISKDGRNEDLMNTIDLPPGVGFNLDPCILYFGGVPPTFHHDTKFQFENFVLGSFLGKIRGITISNPGSNSLLNPLYTQRFSPNPYFGVFPHCKQEVCYFVCYKSLFHCSLI